jgi:hypothetical protein
LDELNSPFREGAFILTGNGMSAKDVHNLAVPDTTRGTLLTENTRGSVDAQTSANSAIRNNGYIRSLFNVDERSRIQPALICAGLALATLMRSIELELCGGGRSRALWLRDAAQSNLEQTLNTQWIDLQLAEAALVRHFIAPVHAVGQGG